MDQKPLAELFLGADASLEERWRALRLNVQIWYERCAQAEGRGEIGRSGDLLWTYNQCTIPSEAALEDGLQIDLMLDWYRRQSPLHGAIFWYLHPTPPVHLGARLFARGVGPNWQPHWMWCDLAQLQPHPAYPSDVEIRIRGGEDIEGETDATVAALCTSYPRLVWHLSAFQRGQGVGGCMLTVTTGTLGIGGLFDMWVMPQARRQGIGTALAWTVCDLARQLGCRHVVLNATEMGQPVYRRVGFQSMGYGYSWYLHKDALARPAPTRKQVMFLEALGTGDIRRLDELYSELEETQLQEPTVNGLTPLEIAVRYQQSTAAAWLVEHGVVPDILSAWDLGWKELVARLIVEHPQLLTRQGGRWDATPLHIAIERDDLELVKLLLTVSNDLTCKDANFQSTPLGWARYFQRTNMIPLLQQAQENQSPS